jgi:hypothetical protein
LPAWTRAAVCAIIDGYRLGRADREAKFPNVFRSIMLVRGPTINAQVRGAHRVLEPHTVSDQPWPIPIRIARPWGTQTTHILHLPIRATSDHGGWSMTDRGDPRAVEWQRWIADDVCAIPYSKRAPGNR